MVNYILYIITLSNILFLVTIHQAISVHRDRDRMRVHLALAGIELTPSVVTGIDCIGSCNSNYHTITITMDTNSLMNNTVLHFESSHIIF
jgi:hypothetical protein